MSYILIIYIYAFSNVSKAASFAVEFNTKEACQAAAAEFKKQYRNPDVIMCAPKGKSNG